MDQPANYPYPPPRNNTRIVAVILGIAAFVLVALIVGAVFAFRAGSKAAANAAIVADALITDLKTHDYRSAHSLIATVALPKSTLRDMSIYQQYVEKRNGRLISTGKPQWYISSYNGQTSIRLQYPAQFANGGGSILVVLVPEPNGYRVLAYNYNS